MERSGSGPEPPLEQRSDWRRPLGPLASAAMAKSQKIPEGQEYRDAWAALDRDARRRVRRAVNRGRPVENRGEARVAVALARSQRRFWRWGWIIGPGIVAGFTIREELIVVLVNVGLVAVVVGMMSLYFTQRSKRAEQANLAVVERRKGGQSKASRGGAQSGGGQSGGGQSGGGQSGGGQRRGGGKNRRKGKGGKS